MAKTAKYAINEDLIIKYINTVNNITTPMKKIKEQISDFMMSNKKIIPQADFDISYDDIKTITAMIETMNDITENYPKEKKNITIYTIKNIIDKNNGIITTRMIEPLNISRQYLSILEKKSEIIKTTRGIYVVPKKIEDNFYSFQQKNKKAIFSHTTALYLHNMTEEIPYNYTVTVPYSYHNHKVNENCQVFYTDNNTYNLGLSEVKTPNGNMVKTYDLERCICDIIRSKNRMDFEQVKKIIKLYVKNKNKNMVNLSKYAAQMNITDEVMELIGMYYE